MALGSNYLGKAYLGFDFLEEPTSLSITVLDTINVSEFIGNDPDTVYVSEQVTVTTIATPLIAVFDTATVAETVTLQPSGVAINVNDNITVAETVVSNSLLPPFGIDIEVNNYLYWILGLQIH